MTDEPKPPVTDKSGEIFDMDYYRELTKPAVDTSKKGRKAKQKKTTNSAEPDGRSLRATGRTEHLVFKAHPTVKKALASHVGRGKFRFGWRRPSSRSWKLRGTTSMGDRPIATILMLFGFGCVGCEVLGAYEFLWEKHGTLELPRHRRHAGNVAGGDPTVAAEYARRNRQWLKMVLCWLAIPFALLFVLTAGVQRTGLVADTDEATRATRALAIATAQEEIAEAKAQRVKDQAAVDLNCGSGARSVTKRRTISRPPRPS